MDVCDGDIVSKLIKKK